MVGATLGAGTTVTVDVRQGADTHANRTVVPQLHGASRSFDRRQVAGASGVMMGERGAPRAH